MIQLFNGMQSSLSMVYDREMGGMRVLLTSPMPRWFLLVSKLMAGTVLSLPQVYVFLLIARLWGVEPPAFGYLTVLPALLLSAFISGAPGLMLSSLTPPLANVAGVMGGMRVLLTSPMPRWFLLVSKLMAGTVLSLPQVYVFLLIARLWGVEPPAFGYLTVVPALLLSGLMLGALGLMLSSLIRQLENFAGVMNFVIFPMFFASSALYPLWRVEEASPLLHDVCAANPFTYAVELVRSGEHTYELQSLMRLVYSAIHMK